MNRRFVLALGAALLASSGLARALPVDADRAVVRFDAPEAGGVSHPQFIFERELAFEARIEALADTDRAEHAGPFLERHVRAALERHVAEELLSHLAVDPEPTQEEISRRTASALVVLEQRIGGHDALVGAAKSEGLDASEVRRVAEREARASLYLDRMVAPMLDPGEAELREVHRSPGNPFRGQRFDDVVTALRAWYVGERLEAALGAYYQNARGRVHVVIEPR